MMYCYKEHKHCVRWVEYYFSDCLCSFSDDVSFGLGVFSLLTWGVAEVPQIISNFRTKSAHGLSFLFLLTWVIGDAFNLVGCLLEPATLPTQYYTAVFYTVSTLILVSQSLYYDHIYTWFKCRQRKTRPTQQDEEDIKRPLRSNKLEGEGRDGAGIPIPSTAQRAGLRTQEARKEFYYMSARSLAGSNTPPFRSYLRDAKSGPSAVVFGDHHSSSEDENQDSHLTAPASVPAKFLPSSIPRMGIRGAVVAATAAAVNLPFQSNAMAASSYKGFTGSTLLQEHGSELNAIGQWMGWMMAAIYIGARVPQIVFNIKKGSVEGLNPLLFIFALVANTAYVASILVRSREWEKIKANMPWLLDAVGCVVLDIFIIWQYVYYKYYQKKRKGCYFEEEEEDEDYYVEAE